MAVQAFEDKDKYLEPYKAYIDPPKAKPAPFAGDTDKILDTRWPLNSPEADRVMLKQVKEQAQDLIASEHGGKETVAKMFVAHGSARGKLHDVPPGALPALLADLRKALGR
jgi:hypothetical protein